MTRTQTRPSGTAWPAVEQLARDLVAAWGAWGPTLTGDGARVAYVSDRRGRPELWVQDLSAGADSAAVLPLSEDPVLAVHWSPDAQWLAASVATGGGVRSEVWVVRPDGTGARRVAGGSEHAVLGPWAREGHGLVVTIRPDDPMEQNRCLLIDPAAATSETVAVGQLIDVMDLTVDGRFALLRDGTRGAQFCRLVDRQLDVDHRVLPYAQTGSTDGGLLRPPPPALPGEEQADLVTYLVTDAGLPRRELVAIGEYDAGRRIAAGALAARDDAELEFADADAAGRTIAVVWNVAGRSELELIDTATGVRCPCPGLPGEVVSGLAMARGGSCVVAAVEGPAEPRALWRVDCTTLAWARITPESLPPAISAAMVAPTLIRFDSHDGLPMSGWLYPAVGSLDSDGGDGGGGDGDGGGDGGGGGRAMGPAFVYLHGGPEAQERPVFTPQHQVLAAAGVTVFAPNIRGSSGFGRSFVHADDRHGRVDAIRDVAECARVLDERGLADPARIAVGGRSYGGYATLMALARHAPAFAAGVDICGMSDLHTFYRDTEPWIAAAAVTKYGDPVHDGALLAELSPLHLADAIDVPLLVVHGSLDTNVPLGEATQLVARLRALNRPVEYLELIGEGHEYRRADSKLTLLEALTDFVCDALDA